MNQRKAGVILSYISMALNGLVGFVYVPMLLFFLTKEQYGLFQLVGSMIAYLTIMDFGLANTITRYYSRYIAQGDEKSKENLLATALRLYIFISLTIIVIGLVGINYFLPIYSSTLSPYELNLAKQVFGVMLINLAIIIPGNIFYAVIQANQHFIFLRTVNIVNIILQPLLVFIILHFKSSILTLAAIQTACNIGVLITNIYYSFFKLHIKIKLHTWNKKLVKEILYFSFFIFLNVIMDQIYWKTGQLVLGAVMGTSIVAVYSIAMQLDLAYMNFSTNLSSVFLPHLTAVSAKTDDMTEINQFFIKIGRLQFYIVMLICFGFWLYGKPFISFWIGGGFDLAYVCALILMIALIIPLIQNTGVVILQAKNKHSFRSIVYVIIALLNLSFSIPVAKHYGAIGCATVTGLCLLLGPGLIINIYYAKIGINVLSFFRSICSTLLPMIIAVSIAFIIKLYYPILSILDLALQIILFSGLFIVLIWFWAFNQYEQNLFSRPIKRLLKLYVENYR